MQRLHAHRFLAQGLHRFDGRFGGLDRRDAGDAELHRGGADPAFVGAGSFAARGVDDELDLAIILIVQQVRPAFGDLLDWRDRNARFTQAASGSFGRHELVAERGQPASEIDNRLFMPG